MGKTALESICQTRFFKRSVICLSVLASLGTAAAQEDSETDEEEKFEQIEVRGIRASMAENLAIKRLSNSIVDAITAEDIGKFPDKNVADALQRVPGVVITRDGGEGQNVSIRGLSSELTLTQLNGNYIASTPGSPERSFNFVLLPSTMVQRVEVFKSSEARLDEGGVGGTVIVHSRKPLDMEAGSGILNVEYTYADVTEKFEPNFSGVYSWKNEEENFGILVGYTHQQRTNRTLQGNATGGGGWRFATSGEENIDVNGNVIAGGTRRFGPLTDAFGNTYDGVWVPQVVGVDVTEEDRVREGIQGTIQYSPMDNLSFTFNYFQFSLGQDRTISQMWMPEWKLSPDYLTGVHLDPSNTVVTGLDYTSGAGGTEGNLEFPWILGSFTFEEDTSDTYDFHFEYEGDNFDLRGIIGRTEARGGPSESWFAAYKSGQPGSRSDSGLVENAASYAGWRLNDRVELYADPALLDNLQAGIAGDPDPGSTGSSFITSELEENYIQLDLDYHTDWSIVQTLRFGVKHRDSQLHRETANTFFITREGADRIASGDLDPFNQGAIDAVAYQRIGAIPEFTRVLNADGEDNIPGGFSVNIMPTINWQQYRDIVTSEFVRFDRREPNFVFDIGEEITAAYVQGDFAYEDFRGNFGVRYVETQTTVSSTDSLTFFLDDVDDVTGEDVLGFDRNFDIVTLIERTVTNEQLLPSFNLVWDATDDLVVRFAGAQTMSRPGLNALGRPERLSFISQEWADDRLEFRGNPVDQGWSGSGGNKALQPFESTQFDLSVEYYFEQGSAIGAALFNKDVDNFVVPLIITSGRPSDGFVDPNTGAQLVPPGDITVTPFSTDANGSNAISRGLELFAQHNFENGFGFNINYTYNYTNKADVDVDGTKVGESELIGSADNQFNFSTYYEDEQFSVRASYNRRGQVSLGLTDGLTIFSEPYQQVDLNASYNVWEALILSLSVINLTQEEERNFYGDDTEARLASSLYSGRRLYAGLTYRF